MDSIFFTFIGAAVPRMMVIALMFSVTFCDMDNGKDLHDIVLSKIDNKN